MTSNPHLPSPTAENTEHQRIEASLRTNEEKYRLLVENQSDLIIQFDSANHIRFVNQRYCTTFGKSEEELLGSNFMPLVHEEDRARVLESLQKVLVPPHETQHEERDMTVAGWRWFAWSTKAVLSEAGKVASIIGVGRDINERKQAEEERRASEEKYVRLVEGVPDIIYSFSSKRGGIYYSTRVEAILGYTPKYLLEHPFLWQNSIEPADLEGIRLAIEGLNSGKSFDLEYRIRDSVGKWHWLRDRSIGRHEDGDEVIVEGIATDITERKRIEERLRDSEESYRNQFNANAAVMLLIDPLSGAIIDANAAAVAFYGYPRERLLSMRITDINMLPEAEVLGAMASIHKNQGARFEFQHRLADGSLRSVEVSSSPIQAGEHWKLHSIIFDITERKCAEEKVRQLAREQQIILENANIGISLIRDRKQVWINNKTVEMFQYPRVEMEGHSTRKLYPSQEAYDQLGREAYPVLAKGMLFETVQLLMRGDGVQIWVRYNGKAIDPTDLSKGVLWLLEDITERKRMEKESEEIQGRLVLAMDQAHLAYWEMDATTGMFAFNDRFYALYATTAEREGGYQMSAEVYAREFVPPAEQHIVPDDIAKLLSGETDELKQEHVIRRRDGELRHIAVRISVVRDASGHIVGTRGCNQDITDRKLVETALRASEARLKAILENSNEAFGVHLNGIWVVCNPASARLFGVASPSDLLGTPIINVIAPEERERIRSYVRDRNEGKVIPKDYATQGIRVDGTKFELEVSLSDFSLDGEKHFFVILRDVTERNRAERQIKRLTSELSVMMGSIKIGISFIRDRKVQTANTAHDRMFGYSCGETVGMPTDVFYTSPEDSSRINQEGYAVLARGEFFNTEIDLRRKDGSSFPASITGRAIDPNDLSAGSIWQVEDITERVQQQQVFRDLLKQADRDARTKGELLREVNHRVMNNLTAVLGLMAFERRYSSGEPKSITAALERLDQRIRGLLQVHRMLSQTQWAPVGVNVLAGQIIRAVLSGTHARQSAVLTITPNEIKISPRQAGTFAMVINELATNTVKYGRKNEGPIAISFEVERGPEFLVLRYRDNGPGFPPEVLALERSNVGLKLIREMVTNTLGGSVELTNDHGAVTTMHIALEEETRT